MEDHFGLGLVNPYNQAQNLLACGLVPVMTEANTDGAILPEDWATGSYDEMEKISRVDWKGWNIGVSVGSRLIDNTRLLGVSFDYVASKNGSGLAFLESRFPETFGRAIRIKSASGCVVLFRHTSRSIATKGHCFQGIRPLEVGSVVVLPPSTVEGVRLKSDTNLTPYAIMTLPTMPDLLVDLLYPDEYLASRRRPLEAM